MCSGFTPTGKKHRWNFWASPFFYYKEKPASDRRFLQAFREGVSEEKNVWEKSVFFSESYLFCLIRQGRGRASRQWRDSCQLRSWDCCPPGRSGPLSPVVVGYKSGNAQIFNFRKAPDVCLQLNPTYREQNRQHSLQSDSHRGGKGKATTWKWRRWY